MTAGLRQSGRVGTRQGKKMLRTKNQNKKAQSGDPPPSIDTLILIGNGFDIWQGLPTCYSAFEAYYHKHRDEILKKLRIRKHRVSEADGKPVLDEGGNPLAFSDVELLYGDPFDPDARLPYTFWNRFEDSLDQLDAQRLNEYFGKEAEGLKEMRKSARNARRILTQAFCDWVTGIKIDDKDEGYRFGKNCLFVNFNYTDTLVKRFHIDPAKEYHIHGEAAHPGSIIFGHATHPEYPFGGLFRLGGRFRGLYFVEDVLYRTDKHVEDNWGDLCVFLAMYGVQAKAIRKIYVLGHSFGDADMEYFRHIVNATQGIETDPEADLSGQEKEYLDHMDPMEVYYMNIQYAVHGGYRAMGILPNAFPPILEGDEESERQLRLETAVVRRRFLAEQRGRDEQRNKAFLKLLGRGRKKPRRQAQGEAAGQETAVQEEDCAGSQGFPEWHISYHSPEDKQRIGAMMHQLHCDNFTLYPTIDECIAPFARIDGKDKP